MKLTKVNTYISLFAAGIAALLLLIGVISFVGPDGRGGQREVYWVDAGNSQVYWRMDLHHGVIPLIEGKLIFENDKLIDAYFKVAMDSLRDTDIEYELMRNIYENTIKSKEVFNTTRYPYGFFRLYSAEHISKDSLALTGDFELMEIEHCIQFNTFLSLKGDSLVANSDTISINRLNWGIIAMSKEFGKSNDSYVVSDTIRLQVQLSGALKGKHERRQQRDGKRKGR